MSSWKMIVDFKELREIAEEIKQMSGQIQKMAEEQGEQVMAGIKAAWFGNNADAFTAKEVKLINRLYEAGQNLNDVAIQLEEKAEWVYSLEKGNVLTAQIRTY